MIRTVWTWTWKVMLTLVVLWCLLTLVRLGVRGVRWSIRWRRQHPGGRLRDTITFFPGTALVWEVGDTLYQETWESREQYRRGGPVVRFDPASATSAAINVLDLIAWGTPEAIGQLQRLVIHLLAPEGLHKLDPVQAAAVPLLTSIIMHCHLVHCHTNKGRHLPRVLAWMLDPTTSLLGKVHELMASTDPVVASGGHNVLDLNDSLRAIVWQTALAPLTVFQDPIVAANTTHTAVWVPCVSNTFHTTINDTIAPFTLYCCVHWSNLERLGGLCTAVLQMLLAQLGHPTAIRRYAVLVCVDPRLQRRGGVALAEAMASLDSAPASMITRAVQARRMVLPQKDLDPQEQESTPTPDVETQANANGEGDGTDAHDQSARTAPEP